MKKRKLIIDTYDRALRAIDILSSQRRVNTGMTRQFNRKPKDERDQFKLVIRNEEQIIEAFKASGCPLWLESNERYAMAPAKQVKWLISTISQQMFFGKMMLFAKLDRGEWDRLGVKAHKGY